MRLLELFLNEQAVDLPTSTRGLVKFSQARSALADVGARVGEYSFPFTLPASRRNAQVLGVDRLHPQALAKFGPGVDFPYELRCLGRVFTGTARLTSLKNGYTITLLGEGLSWARLLGDKKLTDLEFAPVAYDGSQLESILTKDCDSTDLQFPFVAYGNFFTPPTMVTQPDGTTREEQVGPSAALDYPLSVDDYPPGVYYGNVLRQIFAGIGWHLVGRELDSDFWRQVVMLPAGADLENAWPWGALLQASARGASPASFSYLRDSDGNYSNTATAFDLSQNGEIFYLPVVSPLVASPTRAFDAPRATYTAPRAGTYSFEWEATLRSGRQVWRAAFFQIPELLHSFKAVGLGLVTCRAGKNYDGADGGLLGVQFTGKPADYASGQDRVFTPQRLDVAGGNNQNLAIGTTFRGTTDIYLEAGDTVQLATFARRRTTNDDGGHLATRVEFVLDWAGVSFACTGYTDNDGVSKTQLRPADFLPPLSQREVVRDFLLRTDCFILPDASRRVATMLSRSELSRAGGEPIDLSALCDVRSVEYLPAAGAGVGSFLFAPAENDDDPLTPKGADVVLARIGPGDGQQEIGSLFAPVGFRYTSLKNGVALLPTCATKELLGQNRSEAAWEVGSQAPRLLRYTGLNNTLRVPFMQSTVPLAQSAWDGPLAWDGVGGAVATYYADTLRRAVVGHLARVSLPVSPALYQGLGPGRLVYLHGASYSVEALTNWDAADAGSLAQLDLSRQVF
jgi:hypothetical protein